MPAFEWLSLLVKAGSTAMLVVAASRLAVIFGPFWGALAASLPVSAGPAYLFLTLRHDDGFIADSALASAACNAATGLFLIVYSRLATLPAWRGLGFALAAWVAGCAAINTITWTPIGALLLNLIVFGAGFRIAKVCPMPPVQGQAVTKGRFDLAARAVAVALLVCLVVTASTALGPALTGYAAVFPISLASTIVILRPRIGGMATAALAGIALRAMLGFGVALLALHVAIGGLGSAMALLIGLLVSLLWSCCLLLARASLNK